MSHGFADSGRIPLEINGSHLQHDATWKPACRLPAFVKPLILLKDIWYGWVGSNHRPPDPQSDFFQ
jgi:hypothetical protein